MKKFHFVFLLLAIIGCTLASKRRDLLQPIADTQAITADIATYLEKYPGEDAVYLSKTEKLFHHGDLIEAPRKYSYQRSHARRYPSQNRDGIRYWQFNRVVGQKYLVFNPDYDKLTKLKITLLEHMKLKAVHVRVTSPTGDVQNFSIEDLSSRTEDDNSRVYSLSYPNVVKGTIIEESIEIVIDAKKASPSPPVYHDIPLELDMPCELLTIDITYPDWWFIDVKRLADDEFITFSQSQDRLKHQRHFALEVRDIPSFQKESYAPYFKQLARYLELQINELAISSWYYKSPGSCLIYANQVQKYILLSDGVLKDQVQKKVDELATLDDDVPEIVDKILAFVHENIELVDKDVTFSPVISHKAGKPKWELENWRVKTPSDKSLEDHASISDANNVLEKRKGDAYQITGLTHAMLQLAGLSPKLCVVHSARSGFFDDSFVSGQQLRVPALELRVLGEQQIIFPYLKYLKLNQIPPDLQGETALTLVNPDSVSFWTLPAGEPTMSAISETYVVDVDEGGKVSCRDERKATGFIAASLREGLEGQDEAETQKAMKQLLGYKNSNLKLITHEIANLEDEAKPLQLKLEYLVNSLTTISPGQISLDTESLFSPASLEAFRLGPGERHHPIRIHFDEVYEKKVVLNYPQHWVLVTLLEDHRLENLFGYLEVDYEVEEGKITVMQRRFLRKSSAPKGQIDDLLAVAGLTPEGGIVRLDFAVEQ